MFTNIIDLSAEEATYKVVKYILKLYWVLLFFWSLISFDLLVKFDLLIFGIWFVPPYNIYWGHTPLVRHSEKSKFNIYFPPVLCKSCGCMCFNTREKRKINLSLGSVSKTAIFLGWIIQRNLKSYKEKISWLFNFFF